MSSEIIQFVRQKDFKYLKELGRGACGKTVLLHDDVIDEKFVCKKYEPIQEEHKEELFQRFIDEIKLLHLVHHNNIVRIFNYYIYQKDFAGFILMEYIQGSDIDSHLTAFPEDINSIFQQTIDGFSYLEKNNILHRDIRSLNIMVTVDHEVKIIDFGFGKKIIKSNNFDKSISLNWWCDLPSEFEQDLYDYKTEVYFVGKLFQKILQENDIESFRYKQILNQMCKHSYSDRLGSFVSIRKSILSDEFYNIEFSDYEKEVYREFSSVLFGTINKIEQSGGYYDDVNKLHQTLDGLHKKVMLEEFIPNNALLISCFIKGAYNYRPQQPVEVIILGNFILLLRSCSQEKRNLILSNLYTKLDTLPRFYTETNIDDDVPF